MREEGLRYARNAIPCCGARHEVQEERRSTGEEIGMIIAEIGAARPY